MIKNKCGKMFRTVFVMIALVAAVCVKLYLDALDAASGIPGCGSLCVTCGMILPVLAPFLWVQHALVPDSLAASAALYTVQSLIPQHSFDDKRTPDAPDYSTEDAWAALPHRRDCADVNPPGLTVEGTQPEADVFFLHPSTFYGSQA